ncbi:hypothetical protein Tco_1135648 [Tanacetum coccineum]
MFLMTFVPQTEPYCEVDLHSPHKAQMEATSCGASRLELPYCHQRKIGCMFHDLKIIGLLGDKFLDSLEGELWFYYSRWASRISECPLRDHCRMDLCGQSGSSARPW